jgi:hypothetical protein
MNYIATNNAEIKIPPIQKPVKCTYYRIFPAQWNRVQLDNMVSDHFNQSLIKIY